MANSFKKLHDQVMSDPVRRTRVGEMKRAMVTGQRITDYRESHPSAQEVEVDESAVAHIVRESELYLTTLLDYIEALNGHIEIAAIFDDERFVLIEKQYLEVAASH